MTIIDILSGLCTARYVVYSCKADGGAPPQHTLRELPRSGFESRPDETLLSSKVIYDSENGIILYTVHDTYEKKYDMTLLTGVLRSLANAP